MAQKTPVAVAVIVVTFNSHGHVDGFADSLRQSQVDGPLRLVVVDNASTDGTLGRFREAIPDLNGIPTTLVDTGRNAGYAAGMNAGIAVAAESDYVLLLNPDIRLEPSTIRNLLHEARASGAGIVVPRLRDADGSLRLSMRREPSVLRAWGEALLGGRLAGRYPRLGEMETRRVLYDGIAEPDWATGAAMLISRACCSAVGRWDESFFLYSEETDFALRARDAGFPLRFTPAAEAVHFEGDSHQSRALYSLLVRNRVKLYRSRHSGASTLLFRAGVFVGVALRAADPTRRAAALALLGRTSLVAGPTS
ncbi:glycosyltransferase family 2 protein [Cryobacterium arcticum]|uniref:Glycosyltransferase family 2 protein n=1 Tax=Cryobacterium arcticum TaxID=670052 RepID=A0A317ZLF8_9MICO|nr:glycosyltransferase family 2 protein [Cryobacterium arcticum]PXA65720.1 glycosyltransferase family 2 protein [Cryobacterium arcticum]